jgi:hypothetical protein
MHDVVPDKTRDEAAGANDDYTYDEGKGAGIDGRKRLSAEDDRGSREAKSGTGV